MRILYFQDDISPLKTVCLSRPLGRLFVDWLSETLPFANGSGRRLLLPKDWLNRNETLQQPDTVSYEGPTWTQAFTQGRPAEEDICLLNGQALISLDEAYVNQTLQTLQWDAAFIEISPRLQASRETIKLTPQSQVVGFRRLYHDSIEPAELPQAWPHLTVFKKAAWSRLLGSGGGFTDFSVFLAKLQELDFNLISLHVGGTAERFEDERVFLECLEQLEPTPQASHPEAAKGGYTAIGPVYTGRDVTIEPDVTLVGPVVLSDRVHVKAGAVIRRSIIGEGMTIPGRSLINNRLYLTPPAPQEPAVNFSVSALALKGRSKKYRRWPLLSYERIGKRIFDICMASVVLVMLIPVFPVVILMIKLTSPGPIFYKARRQGLHGREFGCLKFRTMMHKSDSIQERLRVVNQVDGPQFKIDNDPRISGVGRFLRDTCIDELPQFINVLFGQMSIVGPRPSPENENDSCPPWRDARLSVRPGITGLWQICRTRRAFSDFQEWVYYDTEYVRNLSFRKDLWICLKTAQKLIKDFLGQFG